MAWKKIINDGDGVNALANVDTATDGISTDDVLKYNGTNFVPVPVDATFALSWDTVAYTNTGTAHADDHTDSTLSGLLPTSSKTVLIGESGTPWITGGSVALIFSNSVEANFSDGDFWIL